MLNWAKYDGNRNENGELEVDIETLLRSWITPDSRMGFIRGNYLDVFGAALIIALVLFISLGYGFYKVVLFAFRNGLSEVGNHIKGYQRLKMNEYSCL
ncbi:UDP-Glycosyltransferase/glycogen phosphorylase [Gigaspora margarita]|uniref:UDP-Glycosyltransferase/glycogen phosphorylase n=1 Tax=Gigaspora margarita TaxID=4874 RepID=A0A8H3XJ42_GIGMA|nr:UDP-Glycosyltransferase/glycogen phosphorylase [Gigaspora margarita]